MDWVEGRSGSVRPCADFFIEENDGRVLKAGQEKTGRGFISRSGIGFSMKTFFRVPVRLWKESFA